MHASKAIETRGTGWLIVRRIGEVWLWPAMLLIAFGLFTLWPGSMMVKAHNVLHGLCAQQPGHSVIIGDQMLPFDARMTGIYGGTLITFVCLAAAGRLRQQRDPAKWVFALCLALLGAMGLDGFNSLLTDLGLWHPYETTNLARLITGAGAGVAIAIVLGWLFATTVWSAGERGAVIEHPSEILPVLVGCAAWIALIESRAGWLYLPVTYALVLSAWLTLSALVLVLLILTFRRDRSYRRLASLHVPAALALLGGLLLMAALAGGRFWLEHRLGIPTSM
jgi:uncharacterized membrane protein